MKHVKTYHSQTRQTEKGEVIIEGPLTKEELSHYDIHEKLTAFRPAKKQFTAIKEIADLPEGRIIVVRDGDLVVGYVTYLHPDPLERWSTFNMEDLIILGAIEIAPEYRGGGVGSGLLEVSMMDRFMENYIIISTEYYWHWDLKGTQLSIWNYRKVMEKMMDKGGLMPAPTDDPEIIAHPANCLMVRIGRHVPNKSIEVFDKLRFLTKHNGKNMREGL